MTTRPPRWPELVTGWQLDHTTQARPIFAAPAVTLSGTETYEPGRVAAPAPRGTKLYAWRACMLAAEHDAADLRDRSELIDSTGRGWRLELDADRWNGRSFDRPSYEQRTAVRRLLLDSFAAWIESPAAGAARRAAAVAELTAEVRRARLDVERLAAELEAARARHAERTAALDLAERIAADYAADESTR